MFEPDGSIILDKDFVNPYEDGEATEAIEAYNARGYNPNRDTKTGQFTFGSGGRDGGSLDMDMTQVDTSYRGSHGAPNRDDGVSSPGHDLTNTFPSDIYSDRAARLYSSGYEAIDREAIEVIQSIHNKPNEKVMIYRAVPNKASIEVIHPGDWVAITKGYADYHGESNLNNKYKVLVKEVRAKDIWNNADSIQEWGYDPTVDANYLTEVVKNARGYNPYRDDSTGRFTFGTGTSSLSAKAKSVGSSEEVVSDLMREAERHDSVQSFKDTLPTVYHGSGTPLERFDNELGGAWFTTDMMNADGYGENVYEGYLYLANPVTIDGKGRKWDEISTKYGSSTQEVVGNVDSKKHDGVIFNNIKDSWIDDADAQDPGTVMYAYKPADSFLNDSQLDEIYSYAHPRKNSIEGAVDNGRGYNPNRDPETGRFTFGDGSHGFDDKGFAQEGEVDGDVLTVSDGTENHQYTLNKKEKEIMTRELARVKVRYYNETQTGRDDVNGFYRHSDVRMELNADNDNKRGTFYHEMGHAIDYNYRMGQKQSDIHFSGIRKGNPLYNDKQFIIRNRVSDVLMEKTTMSYDEVINMSDKNWSSIKKGGFTGVDLPNGERKAFYFMKSTLTYPSDNDEVFADGYKVFRTEPEKLQRYAPNAYKLYEELTS